MDYIGTRSKEDRTTPSMAIIKGICADGGLFVPEEIPQIENGEGLVPLSYQELAYEIMKRYLTDFSEEELKECIQKAYDEKFDTPSIAPVIAKGDAYFLELYHGRTLAFKDMALSILPYLLKTAAKKNGIDKEIIILTATSGDTGKAALAGFANVPGVRIMVFFPEDGVSPVQKLQMVTQEGDNACVAGIRGNFDDAQSAVKEIFTDQGLKKELEQRGFLFSSANSINIGRLVPQIVYYFYAYNTLVRQGEIAYGETINFTVPTGNFGNILAGYYAKRMGLPIHRLLCASNDNKVLYDFFQTGDYNRNREFYITNSPSMDILISSNLERLLFQLAGQNDTKAYMEALARQGCYHCDQKEDALLGEYATSKEAMGAIADLYKTARYTIDPHTAVAYAAYQKYKQKTGDLTKTVVVSTASPYKFAKDVLEAMTGEEKDGALDKLLEELEERSGTPVPEPILGLTKREVRHKNICEKGEIKAFVSAWLS